MDAIGWHDLALLVVSISASWTMLTGVNSLLMDPDPAIQEQAFHVARHIADGADDVDLLFHELGSDVLGLVAMGMQSENDDVLQQVCCSQREASSADLWSYDLGHLRACEHS